MRSILFIPMLAAIAACSSTTNVTQHVGSEARKGTYIIALTEFQKVRRMFEDRLAADMAERGLTAYTSYNDLPDTRNSTREEALAAARARNALFVLAVEDVVPGQDTQVQAEGRITRERKTLQEFFEQNKPADQEYDPDKTVFVEVSAFQIRDTDTILVWSGTTWSFRADGQGGAIGDISSTIADAIDTERNRYIERYGSTPGDG